MFVGSRRLTLILILAPSLWLAPVAAAQTAARDLSVFNTIATGSKLSVKLKTGKRVEGRLAGVSDESARSSATPSGAAVTGACSSTRPRSLKRRSPIVREGLG